MGRDPCLFVSTLAPPAALYAAMRIIPTLMRQIGIAARLDNPLKTMIVKGYR